MKPAVLLTLLLLGTECAEARLGEDFRDLKRRYGMPLDAAGTKQAREDKLTFTWDRYTVTVVVSAGLSVSEEFTRLDGREFTSHEIRQLLVVSSDPGLSWTQVDGSTWKQMDRTAVWTAKTLRVQEKARGL